MTKKLPFLQLCADEYHHGVWDKELLASTADRVLGEKLSPVILDVLFRLFDDNDDGSLSADEFTAVVSRKILSRTVNTAPTLNVNKLSACILQCGKAWMDESSDDVTAKDPTAA